MILTPAGYAEAIRREIDRRDRAWLAVPLPVGPGVTLRPYTLRMHLAMSATGNRLATSRGEPELADVLSCLWCCSTAYCPPAAPLWRLRRWLFWRRCARLTIAQLSAATQDYFSAAWGDCPSPLNKPSFRLAPKTSAVSQYILRLRPLGWTDRDVLDRPMGIVWQMLRAIDLSEDSSTSYDDESQQVLRAYMVGRNARAQDPAPPPAN